MNHIEKMPKFGQAILRDKNGQNVYCRSHNQLEFVKAIEDNDIIIVEGTAGTAKTFLSTVMAIKYLREGLIDKIVVTRPSVSAGENLGFLPGGISEKMNPYLRPIYDVLDAIGLDEGKEDQKTKRKPKTGPKEAVKETEEGIKYGEKVELSPIAYCRGMTFNRKFVILDEAENCTIEQIYLVLSRIGYDTKIIVNGDILQSDIKGENGLQYLIDRLDIKDKIPRVTFVQFDKRDIVRNPIIGDIAKLFGKE